jgi:hypothetical protein
MLFDAWCALPRSLLLLLLLLLLQQALKLLGSVGDAHASGVLQLAAQVHFRLDQGDACVEACNKLKAAGQVRHTGQQQGQQQEQACMMAVVHN